MKKTPLLNVALSRLIASLGHGDTVVIGDAGLPVPPGVELIDLALTHGIPDFVSTLKVVLSEMQVERPDPPRDVQRDRRLHQQPVIGRCTHSRVQV